MLRSRVPLAVAVALVIAAPAVAAPKARDLKQKLSSGGQTRSYQVHVPPSYTGKHAVPLVVLLHGATATPEWVKQESQFPAKADREGFLLVCPAAAVPRGPRRLGPGRGGIWNSGAMRGQVLQIDDVSFLRAVVKEVRRTYRIDPKRIYAAGMSNGAMMAQRLGVEAGDVFAAVASVAGTLNVPCPPGPPMPVVMVHGLQDDMVPFDGRGPFRLASVPASVQAWIKRNGCRAAPAHADKGNVITECYAGGRGGAEVLLYETKDGVHAWPHADGKKGWGGLDATDVIWAFFVKHPKP